MSAPKEWKVEIVGFKECEKWSEGGRNICCKRMLMVVMVLGIPDFQ